MVKILILQSDGQTVTIKSKRNTPRHLFEDGSSTASEPEEETPEVVPAQPTNKEDL